MSRIFITGSADGLGRAAAETLLGEGHQVIVHVRKPGRLHGVRDLLDRGALAVTGDLSDLQQTREVAEQVNRLGRPDAVIHNAGVFTGSQVLAVNVIAPYLLTALIARPARLVYLSSSMHFDGRAALEKVDWRGQAAVSYSDSKLFVTALAAAVARRWPGVVSSAVDPGWVPTKMGGENAPDDLRLGHLTQEWLVTSTDAQAGVSGGYWHHQRRLEPHAAARDPVFQDALLAELERVTGVALAIS
ncbi:NAD-dependent epimerase/dehydratase [Serratia sp. AS12]|uniref:SDR family NAD(P)-dependent oxidoreductase n=1 Tax=Serratia TaxID=613 RepID=UPI00020E9F6D|nr:MULTISPECIES: SDR family NAD(P)-dependent oxidoreductase [Serratia]AEF46323.1 NAD-dependent epimerase/dehydratase [Serratia plymuthica AS9]AEF51275.1 NAD-dependent epimerase/dehydratase [Serratia sp. AS12]AEG28983.1 NAD-dependent epimerase/dehydratase [Serratia sp. AS13]UTN95044.1 SDR family NAD(P)-dependent oxidoreductase [Serratia plymuthica]